MCLCAKELWPFTRAHLPAPPLKPRLGVSCSWQGAPHSEQHPFRWALHWRWRWWWWGCDSKMRECLSEEHISHTLPEQPGMTEEDWKQGVFPDSQTGCLCPGIVTWPAPPAPQHSSSGSFPLAATTSLKGTQLQRQIWVDIVSLESQTLAVEWAPHSADGAIKMQIPGPPLDLPDAHIPWFT